MGKLTVKHVAFLKKHGFENPSDWTLDATGMTRVQYRAALSRERKLFAYGLPPCRLGHTMRTSGGCPQCDTSYIAYARRSRLPGYVYIAKCGQLTKIGFSQDVLDRLYIANLVGYAGKRSWRVRACLYSPNAGQIELAAHRALSSHIATKTWERNGVIVRSKEVFRCTYQTALDAVLSVVTEADASTIEEF